MAENYLRRSKYFQDGEEDTTSAGNVTNVNSLYKPVETSSNLTESLPVVGAESRTSPVSLEEPSQVAPTNVLTASSSAPISSEELSPSKNVLSQYWGQPVGKTKLPLDQFVRLAGMTAHALAPGEASGRLGKDLSEMGKEAYQERIQREQNTPNELLKRQWMKAQIAQAEKKDVPTDWKVYLEGQRKLGIPDDKIVESYKKLGLKNNKPAIHYTEDEKGNVSIFTDGILTQGSGKGKDVSKEIIAHETDDKGTVTFYGKHGEIVTTQKGGKTKESTAEKEAAKATNKTGSWSLYKTETGIPVRKNSKTGDVQIMQDDSEWRAATVEEVKNLTGVGGPKKPESEIERILRVRREKKEGKSTPVKADTGKKFTEAQLRSQLTDKKKIDPSIDIEKAMQTYKAKGLY